MDKKTYYWLLPLIIIVSLFALRGAGYLSVYSQSTQSKQCGVTFNAIGEAKITCSYISDTIHEPKGFSVTTYSDATDAVINSFISQNILSVGGFTQSVVSSRYLVSASSVSVLSQFGIGVFVQSCSSGDGSNAPDGLCRYTNKNSMETIIGGYLRERNTEGQCRVNSNYGELVGNIVSFLPSECAIPLEGSIPNCDQPDDPLCVRIIPPIIYDYQSPVDTDLDGVIDSIDECPNEYGTVMGCPAETPTGGVIIDEDEIPKLNWWNKLVLWIVKVIESFKSVVTKIV